jgi:hypothetical protein
VKALVGHVLAALAQEPLPQLVLDDRRHQAFRLAWHPPDKVGGQRPSVNPSIRA